MENTIFRSTLNNYTKIMKRTTMLLKLITGILSQTGIISHAGILSHAGVLSHNGI